MVDPAGPVHSLSGVYQQVDRPHLLVFTWRWDGQDEETLVRLELRAIKGGAELLLTHERFLSEESKKEHAQGWEGCLARLPGALS
jgi:uncharacterized protein YndB with AHSA1/START domain